MAWGGGPLPVGLLSEGSANLQMMMGMDTGKGFGKGDFGKGKKGKGKDKGKDGKGGKGKGAMRIAAGEPCYFGKIKTYDVEKQRGFIVCEEVFNMCGSDVYCFEKVLAESGAGPGDSVAFFLHWSASSGQPQASAPMVRIGAADGGFALKGVYKSGGEGKEHGFLECDVTKEYFGRDVYVNKDTAATFEPGATVAFNVYLNRDKMPNVQANQDVPGAEMCDPIWEPTPGDISTTRTDPNVVSKGKGKDGKGGKMGGKGKDSKGGKDMWGMMSSMMGSWGKGGGKSKGEGGPPPAATGESFIGLVKSFNEKTNYGFIACDEVTAKYGGDCFANGRHLQGLSVGDIIEFDVGVNKQGQPQAVAIRSAGGACEDPAAKRPKLF